MYPWITRRCTNSPDFFLLLVLPLFLSTILLFPPSPPPPRRSSIPPWSTLSSTFSTFSLSLSLIPSFSPAASLLPFDLRFLALPRLNSPPLSALPSPPGRPPFSSSRSRSARSGHWSCYNPDRRLTVAPCMAACFMLAALHCDARRGVRALLAADRNTRGCIHLASLSLSLSTLLNNRPRVTRCGPSWPLRLPPY